MPGVSIRTFHRTSFSECGRVWPAAISLDHPAPGFLNGYSRGDVYQDKAEVFAYLLVASFYRKASPWIGAASRRRFAFGPSRDADSTKS